MLYFKKKKKKKKNNCRYHYQNLDDMIYMIYSSWDIEQNILILIISISVCFPFYPHKNPKIKILKNEKICWRYHHFTHVYQKSQSYCVQLMRYGVKQAEFFVILDHFLPFYPLWTQKIKIVEKWTIHLKNYHSTMTVTWFIVPEIWNATDIISCHLDYFLPFYPPNNPKNENFQKLKKTAWKYHHFTYTCVP